MQRQKTSGLLLIDFDLTISSKHIHNLLASTDLTDESDQWDYIKDIPPRGGTSKWRNIIKTALENGYKVGIVSFTQYPHIVSRYVKEIIFKPEEQNLANQIDVNGWLPGAPENMNRSKQRDPQTADKNVHIKESIQKLEFNGPNSRIILVDDDKKNIKAAHEAGYNTILADQDEFLDEIMARLNSNLAKDNPISTEEKKTEPEAKTTKPVQANKEVKDNKDTKEIKSSIKEEYPYIKGLYCYRGDIDSGEAKAILNSSASSTGDFLFRFSNNRNAFYITIKTDTKAGILNLELDKASVNELNFAAMYGDSKGRSSLEGFKKVLLSYGKNKQLLQEQGVLKLEDGISKDDLVEQNSPKQKQGH